MTTTQNIFASNAFDSLVSAAKRDIKQGGKSLDALVQATVYNIVSLLKTDKLNHVIHTVIDAEKDIGLRNTYSKKLIEYVQANVTCVKYNGKDSHDTFFYFSVKSKQSVMADDQARNLIKKLPVFSKWTKPAPEKKETPFDLLSEFAKFEKRVADKLPSETLEAIMTSVKQQLANYLASVPAIADTANQGVTEEIEPSFNASDDSAPEVNEDNEDNLKTGTDN